MKRHRGVILLALGLMAVPLLYAVLSFAARPSPAPAWLEPPRPGTTCVFPAADVRYEHMRHLKKLRDQVMREGRRDDITGARAQGLGSCRGCHAHREQFCDRCHDRASVRLDCFGCHAY
jgi:hypothetical protein